MQPSDEFTKMIIGFEGEVLHGYLDSIGKLTIGIGHLCLVPEPYRLNQPITKEESRRLFAQDVDTAANGVQKLVKVPLSQNQLEALVSFVFNLGQGALAKSTLLKKLNAKDYPGAANAFLAWNRAGGKVVAGLTRRRKAERELFLKD